MSSIATSDVVRRWPRAFVAALAACVAASAFADGVTQCRSGEQPLFSCSTGKKTVSLCGAPASGTPQTLTYRFGVPGKVENEFVATSANGNLFHTTLVSLAPRAAVGEVWFDRGDVRYVMSACLGGDCPNLAALSVLRHDKIIANMPCRNDDNLYGGFGTDLVQFGEAPKPKTPLLVVDDNYDNDADKIFVIPGMGN
jgi:hypothetical protein